MPDDQLSKQVLIGRNIINTGFQAITNASSTRFIKTNVRNLLNEANSILAVENVDMLKLIEEKDVHCEDLEKEKRKQLIALLNCFRNNVVELKELGQSKIGEMKIELLNDEPVYHRPYHLSRNEREKLYDLIMKFQSSWIIRESSSPYASPAFLVSKKYGESRMVVDFQKLNKTTKLIEYPLLLMDDQIDRL